MRKLSIKEIKFLNQVEEGVGSIAKAYAECLLREESVSTTAITGTEISLIENYATQLNVTLPEMAVI